MIVTSLKAFWVFLFDLTMDGWTQTTRSIRPASMFHIVSSRWAITHFSYILNSLLGIKQRILSTTGRWSASFTLTITRRRKSKYSVKKTLFRNDPLQLHCRNHIRYFVVTGQRDLIYVDKEPKVKVDVKIEFNPPDGTAEEHVHYIHSFKIDGNNSSYIIGKFALLTDKNLAQWFCLHFRWNCTCLVGLSSILRRIDPTYTSTKNEQVWFISYAKW